MAEFRKIGDELRAKMAKADKNLDTVTGKLVTDAEKLAELIATLNRIATGIEKGEGTAGKILTDPQLYDDLVKVTRNLNTVLKELDLLIKQWQKKGMQIKLK
jgi:phospholipid/cholesterol/gamma-HCH transport system substrate-binding protein